MSDLPSSCPKCGSSEIHHRKSRGDWVCDQCELAWKPAGVNAAGQPAASKLRLFLSYGRRDARQLADRLRADLEVRGFEVWQDTRRIRSGREWEQEIEDGLRSTQIVLALLSKHAVRRGGDPDSPDNLDSVCLDEISFARFAQPPKPIVPVLATPCDPPFCIFRLDYVDMTSWSASESAYQAGLHQILEGIAAALRGEVRYRSWVHNLQPFDFSSFLHEKRRDFCGRQWLFDEIDAWRISASERALLLTGDPGTGKSAIVAELVHRNPGGQVLAYHCCQADMAETFKPARFVRSLAAMIASKLPAYAASLEDPAVEQALNEGRCEEDPASAFEEGILRPLHTLPAPEEGVRYLIVDALDEALTRTGSGLNIVDLLLARLERLPGWLRLVATTRKDRAVLDRLRGLRARELEPRASGNQEDLDLFLRLRLRSPNLAERLTASGLPEQRVRQTLLEKSAGNFLYAQQTLQGIERDQYTFARLDDLPPGLFGLYRDFFARHFPDESAYAPVRNVLEVIVAARQPLTEEQLARAASLDADTELAPVLRRLSAFVPLREGCYQVFHRSLSDWLTHDDVRGDLYFASRRRGHGRLAQMGLAEYRLGPSRMSPYGLRHLPAHLIAGAHWDELAALLTDLFFLEAKAEAGWVFELAIDFTETVAHLPREDTRHGLLELLEEALRRDLPFLFRHPESLFQTLWNVAWWYDSPEAEAYFDPPPGGWSGNGPPWHRPGPKLCPLLEHWKAAKRQRVPGSSWLRSLRPPFLPLGSALRGTLRGHEAMVLGVVFAPHGRVLASWSDDHTVRLWDVNSGAGLAVLGRHEEGSGIKSVVFAPDGTRLASASSDGLVQIWDATTGNEVAVLRGHEDLVTSLAFAPNGRRLASGSWDHTVRLWDIDNGSEVAVLRGHQHQVRSVAYSPDGRRLASSGCLDRAVRIWDADSGTELAVLHGHGDSVDQVVFSPDGKLLASASADGTVRVWDVHAGNEGAVLRGHTKNVTAIALSPEGNLLASASWDHTVRVWDPNTGTERMVLRGHENFVQDVVFSPNGRRLASASLDHTARIWDVDRGTQISVLRQGHSVECVAFSPDGRRLATASWDTVSLWDPERGQETAVRRSDRESVHSLVVSPDGRRVAGGADDNTVRVWDAVSGSELAVLHGHEKPVTRVAFAPDGRIASASVDRTVRIWDASSGAELTVLRGHENQVSDVVFTPDGHLVASASWDDTVRIWEADSGAEFMVFRGREYLGKDFWSQIKYPMYAVACAPDGRLVAGASADATVRIWDLQSGTELAVLRGHEASVYKVIFSPDGRLLASMSEDGTVRLWSVASGECIEVIKGTADIKALVAGPQAYPWILLGKDVESVILTSGRQPLVYFPVPMNTIVALPSGRRWMAANNPAELYVLQLEAFSAEREADIFPD